MDFAYTDEQQMVRDTVREFAEAELMPDALKRDKRSFSPARSGSSSPPWLYRHDHPEEYGGTPLDAISECIVIEELSRCDASFGVLVAVHSGLTDRRWSTGLMTSKSSLCCLRWPARVDRGVQLERGRSGSDARRCPAPPNWTATSGCSTHQVVVTNGGVASVYIIFARSHPDAPKKSQTCSAFIVPRETPGLSVSKLEDKMGIRASDTAEIVLKDVRVPRNMVLGGEGNGLRVAFNALDISRIGIASQALGIAQGALGLRRDVCPAARDLRPRRSSSTSRWQLPGGHGDARRRLPGCWSTARRG